MKRQWLTLTGVVTLAIAVWFAAHQAPTQAQTATCDDPLVSNPGPWQTNFCQYVPGIEREIISGGVPRDGIPPIDNPTFETIAAGDEWLQPQSPVIALEVGDVARAYPLAILTRHEIVNDVIDGQPVAVTFCPLCNSAIVFDRTLDGEVHRFGVSGLLRNSDLIMWDDVTESWWQQFTGEAIVGDYTGRFLDILPSFVVSWQAYKDQYPDGQVLSTNGRTYGRNPYTRYDSTDNPFLFMGDPDRRLPATERVLGAWFAADDSNADGVAVAYPFSVLSEQPVINDEIGGLPVVALWQPGKVSALDAAQIDESKDVGMAALFERTLDGEVYTFSLNDVGDVVDDQTGSVWNVFGTATAGPLAGAALRPVRAFPHFWFAWAAFRPDTVVYGIDG